jgi:pimeloyl-ACP methyl ester carboxylesterase
VGRTGHGRQPLVALHGITAQHRAFNAIARHLQYPAGMLGVDLRGRGNSDKPARGYGLEQHAQDVMRVLDFYGMQQAVLVGHSMGAFVATQAALLFPDRVARLVLLDGGWPRAEGDHQDDDAIQAGLARAFSRLSMTFADPDAYLDFWFPGQGLTLKDLPPDLADYYLYDLQRVAGGWQPKALLAAVTADARWNAARSPTAAQLAGITCPVALVRAEQGFFPGTPPLIGADAHAALLRTLDVRCDVLVAGTNHYTVMVDPYAREVARAIDRFVSVPSSRSRS